MPSDTRRTREEERAAREAERAAERAARDEERLRRRAEQAREKAERAEAKVRERSEQAQEQIARALGKVADAEDRAGAKVAEEPERAGGADAPPPAEAEPMVWFREEPTSRRPAHTRADIARAALEIADAEGFDSVSMRRVAQRLGAGTMTLYHYVRNKDELIALMTDQVMAEVVVPDGELSSHWRTALAQIATRSRNAFRAHHWIFERMGDGHPGPNGMRHFEQSLQAVAGRDLDREMTFEVIGQVDDYVFGYALRERQEEEEHERGWPPEVLDFFEREIATGRYPLIREFLGTDVDAAVKEIIDFMGQEGRFERGLNRLLDGIEAEVAPNSRK